MTLNNNIKIPLDADAGTTYGMLKMMNLTHFQALGEFVDNSVQSFIDNEKNFKKYNPNQSAVQVIIDSSNE